MGWEQEEKDAVKLSEWIAKGVRKVLPKGLVSRRIIGSDASGPIYSETQIVEDLVQAVWVNLLETNRLNGKDAYNQGRAHAEEWCRKELKTIPLSQLDLNSVNEDGEEFEEIAPWDEVDLTSREQVSDSVLNTLEKFEEEERTAALELLKKKKPDDYLFIIKYIEGCRVGGPFTEEERMKARDIKRWLSRK